MSDGTHLCAVLVADICGSTRLYETVGDALAYKLVAGRIHELGDSITRNGGTVIKTMGDGILSTFTSADEAFGAAIAMQETESSAEVHIRVGMNYGVVVERDRDVFGDSVNVAAHLLTMAKPSEIVLTGEMVQNLSLELRDKAQFFDRGSLKGKNARTDFYRVAAESRDMTEISLEIHTFDTHPSDLVLYFRNREIVIKDGVREFVIGRSEDCDLVIEGPLVSRSHATIKAQRGNFHIVDHSANGTNVCYGDETPIFLKRELLQLHSSGTISLGPTLDPDPENNIRFDCGSRTH